MNTIRPKFSLMFNCENCGDVVAAFSPEYEPAAHDTALHDKWSNIECANCGEKYKVKISIKKRD